MFATTFCSFACSGAPVSAHAPPSPITSFCMSWMSSTARPGSTSTCSAISLTRSSSRHVAEPVACHLHLDPVHRRRARDVELVPVVASPVEVAGVLGDLDHAEVLRLGADHPDPAGPGDVDVAALVDLHPVGDSLLDHAGADVLEEHAPVGDGAVRLTVEHADVSSRRVVDVQERLVRGETEAVRLLEVVDEELRVAAAGSDPVDALEAELALPLDAEHGHAAVPRIAEVDGAVACFDHVVGAVELLALVVGGDHVAATPGPVRIHAHERARRVLADEQASVRVVGHAVALVARVGDLGDAVLLAPAATDVAGHVAEEKETPLLVPDRALGEGEARAQPLELRLPIDELEELLRLDVHAHLGSFARSARRAEPNTGVRPGARPRRAPRRSTLLRPPRTR